MRMRIQQLKLMRIHADPDTDPQPWVRYLGAGSEEEAAHAAGLAHAPRGDGRQHVLHRVVDGQARCHATTRRVYVPSRHQK